MLALGLGPRFRRIAAVQLRRGAPERVLRRRQLALGDRQQALGTEIQTFFQSQLLLEALAAQPERRTRFRRQVGLEGVDVRTNGVAGFDRGVGQIAEQVQIVDITKGPGQVVLDEPERAVEGLDADLDEDAGRVLDVVAGRLNQPRCLPKLRQHAPRALGRRCEAEKRLRRQAGRQGIRVQLRVFFPGPDLFEVEHPRLDVVGEHGLLGLFDLGQAGRVDLAQPSRKAGEGAQVGVDRGSSQIFEQVVVRVDPVQRGDSGTAFLQITQVVVDEMRQRLGRIHVGET